MMPPKTMQNIPATKISHQQYDATKNDAKYTYNKNHFTQLKALFIYGPQKGGH